jgi:hypothetical protein
VVPEVDHADTSCTRHVSVRALQPQRARDDSERIMVTSHRHRRHDRHRTLAIIRHRARGSWDRPVAARTLGHRRSADVDQ